jgi:molybdenum cofactor synthesis domain-containing protein
MAEVIRQASPSANKAAILIIGNEILSGKVIDRNSLYLCRELRGLGVAVMRVVVVPDVPALIAEEIRLCRGFDLVFTTGGVGPTHDDVTMEGIALGLGTPLIHHPVLTELLKELHGERINRAHLKLAEVPEGTELVYTDGVRFPVTRVGNIYVFPGVPELLKKKFEAIKDRFREAPFYLKRIFLKGREEEIACHLDATLRSFPDLLLGSYPEWANPDHDIFLTLESKDPQYLDAALRRLLDLLPRESIVKVE